MSYNQALGSARIPGSKTRIQCFGYIRVYTDRCLCRSLMKSMSEEGSSIRCAQGKPTVLGLGVRTHRPRDQGKKACWTGRDSGLNSPHFDQTILPSSSSWIRFILKASIGMREVPLLKFWQCPPVRYHKHHGELASRYSGPSWPQSCSVCLLWKTLVTAQLPAS